jgi:hypothetical protein
VSHVEVAKPTDINIPASSLWSRLPVIGGGLGIAGIGATLAAGVGEHGQRAMFSYLWAFAAVLGIALAALGWLLIEHVVRSQWSAVFKRIGESMAASLPLFALLFLPIALLGMHALYPWTHETDEILEKKRWFLSNGFFFGRAVFYFFIWSLFGTLLYRFSVRQDTLGNDLAARDRISLGLRKFSAVGLFFWVLTLSFASIDWLMSLQPHWYSTIFGLYYFSASILAFYAFLTLVSMALKKAGVLQQAITIEHYHDLGKYLFGFTIFWAYIAFSQFMLIWYANIPEETEFFLVRLHGGWEYVSYALPVLHFFIPFFFLLSRHVKRNPKVLAIACWYTLFMHLVDIFWLVMPNAGGHGAHSHLSVSWTDITAIVGVTGIFLAVMGVFLSKNAVIGINDPRLSESLTHENY